jgi:SAM-dependent methyltransferase
LDVGCGPGFFAGGLQRARPGLRVVGVDVDPFVLPAALATLPVVRGDVAALPFAERVFDLVYARLFLRHVPRPGRSVRAMARLVRPGGCVAAIDASDASLWVVPRPPGFDAIAAARARWFRNRGCSGDVGHRLPGLMIKAGLRAVRVASLHVDTALIGPEAFAWIVLEPFLQAAADVLSDPPVLADARQAVQQWTTHPAASGSITFFVAVGQRPPVREP